MQKPHMANRALAAIADCEFRGEVAGSSGFEEEDWERLQQQQGGGGPRVPRPRLARSLNPPVRPLALASSARSLRSVDPPCVEMLHTPHLPNAEERGCKKAQTII